MFSPFRIVHFEYVEEVDLQRYSDEASETWVGASVISFYPLLDVRTRFGPDLEREAPFGRVDDASRDDPTRADAVGPTVGDARRGALGNRSTRGEEQCLINFCHRHRTQSRRPGSSSPGPLPSPGPRPGPRRVSASSTSTRPSDREAIWRAISARSRVRFWGRTSSSTNGRPRPSIRASMSSRPMPWNRVPSAPVASTRGARDQFLDASRVGLPGTLAGVAPRAPGIDGTASGSGGACGRASDTGLERRAGAR